MSPVWLTSPSHVGICREAVCGQLRNGMLSSRVFTVVGVSASVACPHRASIRSAQHELLPPEPPPAAPLSPSVSPAAPARPLRVARRPRAVTCVARPQSQSGRVVRHPLRNTRSNNIMTVT